jgi:heme oxygenase
MPQIATHCSADSEIAGLFAIGIAAPRTTARELRSDPATASLSAQLRARTASLHGHAEIVLGLPGAIRTLDDYRTCLCRFLALYAPLERLLATFGEWDLHNVALPSPSHSARLTVDLAVVGTDSTSMLHAPRGLLPNLPTFAHALGALYVLEGSTLGGRLILRDVEARIGPQITRASQFFGGRAAAVMPMWQSFKAALDAFGRQQPHLGNDVVLGAESVFRAILTWFTYCRTIAAGPP